MPSIVPIVEGDGDVQAVPELLRRILHENQRWDWSVGRPKKSGGLHALRRKLDQFLHYARLDCEDGGILILVDLDDGCPSQEARALAAQARQLNLDRPVSIVLAHREYEAWFLSSLATVAGKHDLPAGLTHEGDVEGRRGVKEWLTDKMPPGRAYKETIDQVKMTHDIDLVLARQHSRSFRRLCRAVEELVQGAGAAQRGYVSPE